MIAKVTLEVRSVVVHTFGLNGYFNCPTSSASTIDQNYAVYVIVIKTIAGLRVKSKECVYNSKIKKYRVIVFCLCKELGV